MRCCLLLVALAACSSVVTSTSTSADLAAEGGSDRADHDCTVILRQLLRIDLSSTGSGDWETDGSDWVFVATIETAGSAAPSVLYQSGSTWLAASDAVAIAGAPPGSSLWTVTFDSPIDATLQAIPYVIADGARVFDHNRVIDDSASYVLDADNDFSIWESDAQGTCQPPSDSRTGTLAFAADWQATRTGVLVPGGTATITYDASRSPTCRGAGWDIAAHVVFTNAPEQIIASVASGSTSFTIPPDGASQLVIWFENTDATGCDAYDSNSSANYVFPIETRPQWLGDATTLLSQVATDACAGGTDANTGFTLDATARSFDSRSDLCFQVYQPGVTDFANTDIWQQLDSNVHWQLTSMAGETAWNSTPVDFDEFVGNNAQYAFAWEQIDPFRANHCPEIAPDPIGNGLVQIQVQYYVTVNAGALNGNNETGYFFGTFTAPTPTSCN